MKISKPNLIGTWSLVRTYETIDNSETGKCPIGEGATGVLHYLPDDRVAVLMANGGRLPISKGRYNSDDDETAQSARTFTAYAGTFIVESDGLVRHRLDLCLYENDVGTDYVRHATMHGDRLTLSMPPVPTRRGALQWHLEWRRVSAFDQA